MYRKKKISLVIPAYNEQKLIGPTLGNVPAMIDRVYVVDDCSPDGQNEVILSCAKKDKRIVLLKHKVNQGPGGAIITGYLQSAEDNFDIAIVVGGDHQMDLSEVSRFLDPIVDGEVDYVKGNRFILDRLEDTLSKMPKSRLFGNILITALTKIASGYYKTMDVVEGYTAISRRAILTIDWKRAWKKYGYPMDFLIRMNAYGFKIKDVPRTAIYLPGERQSQIKGFQYALKVSPMLLKNFLWRLKFKYIYRDFHPLVMFYYFSFVLLPIGFVSGIALGLDYIFFNGYLVTPSRSVFTALLLISGFQFLLFAMLFDMEEGK
ncbi:glycosyltransferase family 2 protein [Leptospira santarosai]|uniref:glycosyltransferase family 2 protein n=1 Tax=Leptospira santarosai TaxID=28183 RepID=UPI000297AE3D|nr:glycosyltransferase family 2 protein [Leptospira santarosai]EKS08140.1 glycosyltransferase, group 2 family protein [Leptospira santarosai str. JET]